MGDEEEERTPSRPSRGESPWARVPLIIIRSNRVLEEGKERERERDCETRGGREEWRTIESAVRQGRSWPASNRFAASTWKFLREARRATLLQHLPSYRTRSHLLPSPPLVFPSPRRFVPALAPTFSEPQVRWSDDDVLVLYRLAAPNAPSGHFVISYSHDGCQSAGLFR